MVRGSAGSGAPRGRPRDLESRGTGAGEEEDELLDPGLMDVTEPRFAFPATELRRRLARGGVLNAAFLGSTQGLVLLQGLIVTILLGPAQIGLYGIVTVTAMSIVELRRVGVDEAFVQQEEAEQVGEFQAAFSFELALGVGTALVIAAAAPLVALAYGQPELLPLCLAVSYLPVAFALQAPSWIYFRRMDFLRLRLLQASVPVVTFVVTIPLAASGFGVWALVIGPLAGNAVGAIAAIASSPYPLRLRIDFPKWGRYARFSSPVFLTSLGVLVIAQGQIALFGIPDGLDWAGFMTVAMLLTRYADRADQIVATTIYPAVCAIKDQARPLQELFLKSNRLTQMWVLPFCVTLMLFASDLVTYVLGEEWRPAVPIIVGLAMAMAIQQVGYNWFCFYRAQGRTVPQAIEVWGTVAVIALVAVPGFLIFGVWGFVVGRVAAALAAVLVRTYYVHRLMPDVRLYRLVSTTLVPLLTAAIVLLVVRHLIGPVDSAVVPLAELIGWTGLVLAIFWRRERRLLAELRGYLADPSSSAAPA